jgi:hypothetical protein
MYQLGWPLVADSLVTMGLLPKGLATYTLPRMPITINGDPKP